MIFNPAVLAVRLPCNCDPICKICLEVGKALHNQDKISKLQTPITMKVLTPGHLYLLNNFENQSTEQQTLQFIHKESSSADPTKLDLVSDGTTTEDVLKALIDRMQFLQGKFPCRENAIVITKLEESLMWLEKRTADRINRKVEGTHQK